MTPEQQPAIQSNNASLYTWSNLEVQKIANTYLVLHRIFFWLWINFIIIIVAIIIVRNITAVDITVPFPIRNTDIKNKEQQLMKTLSVIESKSYKENDVRVIIKQWPLSVDTKYLETSNNLVVYKWYITPRTIKIAINNDLKKITYFSDSGYDIKFLDLYLNSFILNSNKNQNITDSITTLLPLQTTFAKQFNIECLLWSKIINTFCQQAFSGIASIIPLYDLKQDYSGLTQVAKAVEWTEYAWMFCEAIKKYIFFSNDSGKEIKDIMISCGKQYELSISDFISFRSIQEQLNREAVSSTVTPSALLNIYKLLSTQNDIYYGITVGKNINTTRINGYNNYVEALLKDPDSLQGFYFDVIARYNNIFLIPELTKASITVRWEKSDDYKKILEHMKKINQWDSIARHKWLISYINNPNLLEVGSTDIGSGNVIPTIIDNFTKNYNFSDFIIKSTSWIDDKTLSVSGLLRFAKNNWIANNSTMNATFIYKNQRFLVTSIVLPRHPAIMAIVNQKLAIQPLPIGEVYTLIVVNSKQIETKDVCTTFKWNKSLISCTTTQVIFTQNNIKYTFNYTLENGISSYTISNSTLEKSAKSIYGNTVTITKNTVDAIKIILAYIIEKEQDVVVSWDPIWWAKEVQIQKDFSKIWAEIKEITTNNSNTIVHFTLKDYSFVSIYDSNKKTIIGLWIIIGTTYPIRNFSFSFATATTEEIELFKNDPASFLLQKDPLTVKKLQLK